jgi:hypothetical protein
LLAAAEALATGLAALVPAEHAANVSPAAAATAAVMIAWYRILVRFLSNAGS